MPKWSNCWMWIPFLDNDIEWYIDQVYGRMDHCWNIESEEAENFAIVAQHFLLALIDGRDAFETLPPRSAEETQIIYSNLLQGIQKMISIAESADLVFWTSGYESDGERVREALAQFRLGSSHPDYFHPPHRGRRRIEKLCTLNHLRKELRCRLPIIGPNKQLKRFLHELKDRRVP